MTFAGDLMSVRAALHDVQYSPLADYNGPDTFTITANDLGHTGAGPSPDVTKTVGITVTVVNDAPVVVVPNDQVINQDTDLVVNGILVRDVDVHETSGQLQVTLNVDHGVITLAETAGIIFAPGDTNSASHMTVTGFPEDLNAALSTLKYTPNPHYNGTDTMAVEVNDLGNTGSKLPLKTTGSMSITIKEVPEDSGAGRPIMGVIPPAGQFESFPGVTSGTVDMGPVPGPSPTSFGMGYQGTGAAPVHFTGTGTHDSEGLVERSVFDSHFTEGSTSHLQPGEVQTQSLPLPGLTGLPGYYQNVLAGKMLVFNLDDVQFTELCTDCIFHPGSRPDVPTGLAGYYGATRMGKALVFNIDELTCMDMICGGTG
jgi:hypothetical protein